MHIILNGCIWQIQLQLHLNGLNAIKCKASVHIHDSVYITAIHIQDYVDICVELWEPYKLMQAVSDVKSLTATDGEMLSSAQQQYRWRCVSLSSTLVQEWCFNTVFREKKSQTPTPSYLTELRCDPMRKKESRNHLHGTYLMKMMMMMVVNNFSNPPPPPAFLPIGL